MANVYSRVSLVGLWYVVVSLKSCFQWGSIEECVCNGNAPLGNVECEIMESVGMWPRVWQDSRGLLCRVLGNLSIECKYVPPMPSL